MASFLYDSPVALSFRDVPVTRIDQGAKSIRVTHVEELSCMEPVKTYLMRKNLVSSELFQS